MKILQINSVVNWGSTGKIAEQIGLCILNHDSESYIAYGRDMGNVTSRSRLIRIGNKTAVYKHYIESLLLDNQGLGSRRATRHLIEALKNIHPDLVHLHNLHGYYINYPILFSYLRDNSIPVVWTMHDCWSFTGHCTYFDLVACKKWITGCINCPNKRDYPHSLYDNSAKNFKLKKQIFTNLDKIVMVPVSHWLADLTKKSFMGKYPIQVIHNGIDLSIFRIEQNKLREELNLNGKYIVLGVSSNGFSGRKGLSDFLTLSQILPNQYQIIMIGLTQDELKILPSNIIGIERTANVNELVAYYNLADIFINPTYSDNFPTTNIEALACGTPVITYQTGGSPEALDEKTGLIVSQGDIQTLVSAIQQLCTNPLSSEDCRKRAEEHFDKDKCFEQYIALYNSLL